MRSFLRDSFTALLLATVAQSAVAQPAVDAGPQLKARGAYGAGPLTQAMLDNEALARKEYWRKETAVAKQVEEKLRQLRKSGAPKLSEDQKKQALFDLREALEWAHSGYVKRRRAAAEAAEAWQYAAIVGGAVPSKSVGAILSTAAVYASTDRLENFTKASVRYEKGVRNAVELALLETAPDAVRRWAGNDLSDDDMKSAASELFGVQNKFFDKGLGAELTGDARLEITEARGAVLKDALTTVAARLNGTAADLSQFKKETEGRFQKQSDEINKLSKDVRNFRREVKVQLNALAEITRATQTQVELLSNRFDKLSAEQRATQTALWRQMGPQDRLDALLDPNFLPPTNESEAKKRKDDIAALQSTTRALNLRQETTAWLGAAGDMANIAAGLGVPIDTYNFNKNVATATNAINTIAAFAVGDYFGAIKNLSGFFGSGPSDSGAAQVNAKLDEVMALQRETLQKIEDLSAKITENHNAVMNQLGIISEKLDELKAFNQETSKKGYNACTRFIADGRNAYGLADGLYPSYEQRKKHFEDDQTSAAESILQCNTVLHQVLIRTYPAPQRITHSALWAETWEPAGAYLQSYPRQLAAMTLATEAILGWQGPEGRKSGCARRGLWYLAAAARVWGAIKPQAYDCSAIAADVEITPSIPVFRLAPSAPGQDGEEPAVERVLDNPLSPTGVSQVGSVMLFVAPFIELAVKGPGNVRTLPSPAQLVTRAAEAPTLDQKRVYGWHSDYLDIVDMSLAQQAIMSGAYVAHALATVLVKNNFGEAFQLPADKSLKHFLSESAGYRNLSAAEAEQRPCAVNAASWRTQPYAATICLLQTYPWLRVNVSRQLVLRDLAGKVSRSEYRFLLAAARDDFLTEALPSMRSLVRKDGRWHWTYKLGPTSPVHVDVPGVAEIWADDVMYAPEADALFDLREKLESRLTAIKAYERIMAMPKGAGRDAAEWYLRTSAMAQKSLIEVSLPR